MSGSRPQEREHREIAFRIGGSEHVEIISEIVTVSVGIPADVTVRLVINAVAFTVADPFFKAITGAGFSFPCAGINRCSITSDSKIIEVNQPPFNGFIQKLGAEDIKKTFSRREIPGWFNFEFCQKVIHRYLLDRRSFFTLLFRLFWLLLWRMERI